MLSGKAVEEVLRATSGDEKLVLVGGQAIIFWSSRFADAPEFLQGEIPLASVDIDYVGSARSAHRLSGVIGGEVLTPDPNDHSPNTAVLDTKIDGEEVHIDFLATVKGVNAEIEKHAIAFRLPPEETQHDLRVMHPLHCLISKVANAVSLGRKDAHAQTQLEATPIILREYISELLEDRDEDKSREAGRVLKQLAHFLESGIGCGRHAHLHMERDPLEVLRHFEEDKRLDERFRAKQLASAIQRISAKRAGRAARAAPSN